MYDIEQLVMAYGIEQDRIPCAQVLGGLHRALSAAGLTLFRYERARFHRVPVDRQKEKKWFL